MSLRFWRDQRLMGVWAALFGFVALFPLWSNAGIFWDGWIYHLMVIRGDFENGILEPFTENGRAFSAYIIEAFAVFPNPSWAALIVSCMGISVAAVFFYAVLRKLDLAPPRLAFIASVLGVVFPAYEVSLSLSAVNFQIAVPLFYVGVWLAVASYSSSGVERMLQIGLSSVLLLASYSGEATSVLTLWIPILVGASELKRGMPLLETAKSVLRKSIWLIVLLLFASGILYFAFAPSGSYSGARFTSVSLGSLFTHFVAFWLDYLRFEAAGLVGLILLSTVLIANGRRRSIDLRLYWPIIAGIAGFLLSMVPYVLGHRFPHDAGWSLRFMMFSGFPIGLMAAGFCLVAEERFSLRDNWLRWFLPVVFLLGQAAWVWLHAVDWHLRWLRDTVVMEVLAERISPDVGLVVVQDRGPVVNQEIYREYELISMVQFALDRTDIYAASWEQAQEIGYEVDHHVEPARESVTYKPFVYDMVFPEGCRVVTLDSSAWYKQSLLEKVGAVIGGYLNPGSIALDRKLDLDVVGCDAAG